MNKEYASMTKYTLSNGSTMRDCQSGNHLFMKNYFYRADEVDRRIAELEERLNEAENELSMIEV